MSMPTSSNSFSFIPLNAPEDVNHVNYQIRKLSRSPQEIVDRAYKFCNTKDFYRWTLSYFVETRFKLSQRLSRFFGESQDHTRCGLTARAIMDLNPFDQSDYVDVTLNNLYEALQDDEPGCFLILLDFGNYICGPLNTCRIVSLDHAFVIVKYVGLEPQRLKSYQIVQSYVGLYSLEENMRQIQYFTDFDQLKKVLDPLINFYANPDLTKWDNFCTGWKILTRTDDLQPCDLVRRYEKSTANYMHCSRTTDRKSIWDIKPMSIVSALLSLKIYYDAVRLGWYWGNQFIRPRL